MEFGPFAPIVLKMVENFRGKQKGISALRAEIVENKGRGGELHLMIGFVVVFVRVFRFLISFPFVCMLWATRFNLV